MVVPVQCALCHESFDKDDKVLGFVGCKEKYDPHCLEGTVVSKFQSNLLLYFSNRQNSFSSFQTVLTRHEFTMEQVLHNGAQAYGTESWGILHWGSFLMRLVYQVAVAVIIELGLEIGDAKESRKEFREANVSERLTPLFIEYWGIGYNPELKGTFETHTWNWICAQFTGS